MDEKQEQNLLERLYSNEVRIEAMTMILIEELGIPREKIQEAVDLVIRYSIIAQEEKLDPEEQYRRRSKAYKALDLDSENEDLQEPPAKI